jgi:hypothetical protein
MLQVPCIAVRKMGKEGAKEGQNSEIAVHASAASLGIGNVNRMDYNRAVGTVWEQFRQ